MKAVPLARSDDYAEWRDAARKLILSETPPDQIIWQSGANGNLFGEAADASASDRSFAVSSAFVELAKAAICHRDPERFALLYSLLWRLHHRQTHMSDQADPLIRRIESLAKQVRRDVHKMRAFVRFRELDGRYVAWFEPEHHIVRINAPFFVRRFAAMNWSILTPELSIHWDGNALSEGPGARKTDAPDGDPVEAIWQSYYASIFNPARVKIGAMIKEMPRRYWKNMPETALIPRLIADAQARESAMIQQPSTSGNSETAWLALRDEAAGCTRCPLWQPATQTVFGEGPVQATLMFVGEQPGDQEDTSGRPFVGPAGQLFDKALGEAGIDRRYCYVTNAVKHFKFEQHGKRRLHARPQAGEIEACRWWLDQEQAIISPKVTVALGATAARSLFGEAMAIGKSRGKALALPGGAEAWITVHPSYLLRIPDRQLAEVEYGRFVADLRTIKGRA
jgi:uracil-DNA glycosylase